jgi:hypothetical protein
VEDDAGRNVELHFVRGHKETVAVV